MSCHVSSVGPTIIQDDIMVTHVAQTECDEIACGVEDERFGNVACESIPSIL